MEYEHEDVVRSNARRILGDEDLVNDVVQETYLAAWRDRRNKKANQRAWLARVARNFALMRLRARSRSDRREKTAVRSESTPSAAAEAERRELKGLVARTLRDLDEPHTTVIRLRYQESLTFAEIGDRLGVSEHSARYQVRVAIERIRAKLERPRRGPWVLFPLPWSAWPRRRRRRAAFALTLVVATGATVFLAVGGTGDSRQSRVTDRALARDTDEPTNGSVSTLVDGDPGDPNRVAGPDLNVSGTVYHAGVAQAGVRVSAFRAYHMPEDPRTDAAAPIVSSLTGANGSYALRVPRRTRLTILAKARGRAPEIILVHAPKEGDVEAADMHLGAADTWRFRVVDRELRPIAGAAVRAEVGGAYTAPAVSEAVTDTSGRATLDVPFLDDYRQGRVIVRARGYATLEYHQGQRSILPTVPWENPIVLLGGCTLRGVVRDERGKPVSGCAVTAFCRDRTLWHQYASSTKTDENGAYRLDNLPPLPVSRVQVQPPEGSKLAIVRHDVLEPLSLGKTPIDYDVALRAGQTVSGVAVRARDGAELPGALVRLFWRNDAIRLVVRGRVMGLHATTIADENGRFRFTGLPPGDYALEAVADAADGAPLARFVSRRDTINKPISIDFTAGAGDIDEQRVLLHECGSVRVPLGVPAERFIGGRAPDRQTTIAVRLVVGGAMIESVADPRGEIVFDRVPVGTAQLFVNDVPWASEFQVKAGAPVGVEVVKPKYAVINVFVTDEAGHAIEGAGVAVAPGRLPSEILDAIAHRYVRREVCRTGAAGKCRRYISGAERAQLAHGALLAVKKVGYDLIVMRGIELPPIGEVSEMRVTLTRKRVVAGTVAGVRADEACQIEVKRTGQFGSAWYVAGARIGPGPFRLVGLHPGAHRLRAGNSRAAAAPRPVKTGATEIRLELHPTRRDVFEGALLDQAGRAIPQGSVELLLDGRSVASTRTQPNGTWRFRMPSHPYKIQVGAGSSGLAFTSLPEPLRATPGAFHRIKVQLGDGVSGRITDAAQKPLRAWVALRDPVSTKTTDTCRVVQTDAAGGFAFPGIDPRFTEIVVLATEFRPYKQVLDRRLLKFGIVLGADDPVRGRVESADGRAPGPMRLRLLPANGSTRRTLAQLRGPIDAFHGRAVLHVETETSSDEEGRFEFRHLPPGQYLIVAADPSVRVVRPTPVAVGAAEPAADPVLKLHDARTVRGVITGLEGGPDPSGWHAVLSFNRVRLARVPVDASGTFEFGGVPNVAIRISLEATSGEADPVEVDATSVHVRLTWRDT